MLNAKLGFLHQANLTEAPGTTQGQAILGERMPRHVLQKAREVFLQAQVLRANNGFGVKDVPSFPVGEITPVEVATILDAILSGMGDLRGAYGVTTEAAFDAVSGKAWSDVYHELNIAGASLVALGVPAADANTVLHVTTTIVGDLEQIRAYRGVSTAVSVDAADTKRPGEVYDLSIELLAELQALTERSEFAVPGSIKPLALQTNDVHGYDVLDVVNNVLAELTAIKAVLGMSEPTALAPPQSGSSPSFVFNQVNRAIALIATL